jgi:hypothetical protein
MVAGAPTKPSFVRQGSPARVHTAESAAHNQFETYMQVLMVNPKNKPIYKEVPPVNSKKSEEFEKVTSKPFQTAKGRMTSARKQEEDAQS